MASIQLSFWVSAIASRLRSCLLPRITNKLEASIMFNDVLATGAMSHSSTPTPEKREIIHIYYWSLSAWWAVSCPQIRRGVILGYMSNNSITHSWYPTSYFIPPCLTISQICGFIRNEEVGFTKSFSCLKVHVACYTPLYNFRPSFIVRILDVLQMWYQLRACEVCKARSENDRRWKSSIVFEIMPSSMDACFWWQTRHLFVMRPP